MIDANSGRILSYTDKVMPEDMFAIKRTKVALAIEKALLGIDQQTYEKVVQKLYTDYQCDLFDCYENPEYLNKVIKEIFGENYIAIVKSVKDNLKKATEQINFTDFLKVISK